MRVVPGRHGWGWIVAGWQIFRASPGMWTLMVFGYWLLMRIVGQVPAAGTVLIALAMPAFSVSFMAASDTVRRGEPLRPGLLFAGFLQRPRDVLLLGVIFAGCVLALAGLASGLATLLNEPAWTPPRTDEELKQARVPVSTLVAMALVLPVFAAFWFAPVLAAWNAMGPVKSLFFSFFAFWRNWRAMLVYGAAIAGLVMTAMLLIRLLGAAAGGNPDAVSGMMLGAYLMFMPTLFASSYVAYRDIFPPPAEAPPAEAAET
jgi:hypothetical protein